MGSIDKTASRRLRPVTDQQNAPGTAYLLVVEDDSSSIFHLPRSGAAAGGVRTRAAQLIEMPIRTFTLKLKQYKL